MKVCGCDSVRRVVVRPGPLAQMVNIAGPRGIEEEPVVAGPSRQMTGPDVEASLVGDPPANPTGSTCSDEAAGGLIHDIEFVNWENDS